MVDVTTIQVGTIFAWFMLVLVVRRLILIGILVLTRQTQPFDPSTRLPEDDFRKNKKQNPTITVPEIKVNRDARINGILNNDSENDTYFLILLLATTLFSEPANADVIRTIVYGSIYAFVRIMYALAYLLALQPWRSMIWMVGLFCTLAINLDLVITMSRRSN